MKHTLIGATLALATAATLAQPLGTARTLVLPREGAAYGRAQHVPLPLAPGEVVLTFDDGPRAESTPRVLAALAAEGVKATFFMLGQALEREPALARRVRDAGHTVALHSWAHPNLMQLKPDAQRADLDRAQQAFAAVFGGPPAAYRFPFLAVADDTLRMLRDARVTVVSGDAGAEDWIPAPDAAALTERLMKSLARDRGGIVILHDAQDQTAEALPLMLRTLKDAGYRVVHLEWK